MATIIPQEWFMGEEHEMSRMAWFLYHNEDRFDPELLTELIEHLRDIESEVFIEVGGFIPRLGEMKEETDEELKLFEEAKTIAIKEAQEKELKKREQAKAKHEKLMKENPILALTEEPPSEKPLSESLYDYYDTETAGFVLDTILKRLKRAKESDAKKAKVKKAEAKKPVKKKPVKKKPAKKQK